MLKSSKQTACAVLKGVSMAALLSGALAANAHAEDAKIKSASFSLQPVYQGDEIVITSSDGKKWDTIDAKALKLSASMAVDTRHPGYVDKVGILLGNCNNTGCANNPVMFVKPGGNRDYYDHQIFSFPGNKIPLSKNGIATPSYGDEILNGCNSHLQADGATKSYSFNKLLTASFSANTRKGKPQPSEVQEDGPNGYPDYNGGDVTRQSQFAVKVTCKPYVAPPLVLNKATFHAHVWNSSKCPKHGVVEANFFTDRAGKIDFLLFRDDGANQKITVTTTKKDNKYQAHWHKDYTFAKSVNRKYMIVVMGHKYSSDWKPLVVKCSVQTDAGGPGGKTDVPNPTHGKPNDRPVIVVTPQPPKKPGIKVAPLPRRPVKPGIKVAPLPKLVCIGGKTARNNCFCPARTKKMKFGPNKYRCLKNIVKPKTPPKRVAPAKRVTTKVAPPKRTAPKAPPKRVAPTKRQSRIGKGRKLSARMR